MTVVDDPAAERYPTPLEFAGSDGVFVGRIRADLADPRAVLFWSVADNLRKGAALNADPDRRVPPAGITGPTRQLTI